MDPFSLAAGTSQIVWSIFAIISKEYAHYGLVRTLLLNTIVFQAKTIIERITTHVILSPSPSTGAAAIRNSYNGSFNMIAVAVGCSLYLVYGGLTH